MDSIKRHPLLSAFLGLVVINLPQAIEAWLSLWDRLTKATGQTMNLDWLLSWDWLFRFLGFALLGIVIWQSRKSNSTSQGNPIPSSRGIKLEYLGKLEDAVGPGASDRGCRPDGHNDGTFELIIDPSPSILDGIELVNPSLEGSVPGFWKTAPDTIKWVLGVSQAGKRLNKDGRKLLGIDLTKGVTLRLYVSDYPGQPRHLQEGSPCEAILSLRDINYELLVRAFILQSGVTVPSIVEPRQQFGMTGSAMVLTIPETGSPKVLTITYDATDGKDKEIDAHVRPRTLRFLEPTVQVVHTQDLPIWIPCGDAGFWVKRFTDKGFTVDEHFIELVQIRVEVYQEEISSP